MPRPGGRVARETPRGPTPEPPPPGTGPGGWSPEQAALAAIVVFQGAVGYDFAQDDFAGLARGAGLLPRLHGPWRYLSGQAYFDVMHALAGLNAWAYHAASLGAHAVCGALLAWLLARVVSRPAAVLGAVFFATHPALFTALYSVSGIGEILAGLLALASVWLALAPRPRDLGAPAAYGLSLLCKESAILLPAAVACGFLQRPGERPPRRTLAVAGGLALAYAAWFVSADVFRVRTGIAASAAYALGDPLEMGRNLLTYLGWTANIFLPTVRGVGDAVDPGVFAWGAALALLWLAGLAWPALRRRGWAAAGVAYLLLLAPVLPLRNHTYHYYLYAPLTAAGAGAAALADALFSLARDRRAATTAIAIATLALAVNAGLLVHKIETAPFIEPDMRADATVDRARIVRNVRAALASEPPRAGERIAFWTPALAASRGAPERAANERYWAANLQAALMDGLAVRVLFPQVDSVMFVEAPDWHGADRVAIYQRTGVLSLKQAAEVDSMLRQHPLP